MTTTLRNSAQFSAERRITLLGMVLNILLTAAKVGSGILSNSSAIIADGLHSLSDLASDIAVLWGIRAAKRPADADHHYGHFRYETLTALFVGILLGAAALFIAYHAIITIGERHTLLRSWLPFYIALVSIVSKELLYWLTRAVGRRYSNQALLANAWHHRSDAFSSIAAAAGIAGALLGGARWAFLDHLTAVLLAAFLIYVAVGILRDCIHRLTDRAPDADTLKKLRAVITKIPGVVGFHAFRARSAGSGNKLEMDVHIQVDPEISVRAGHEIAHRVEQELRNSHPDVTHIVIHIEPEEGRENQNSNPPSNPQ